MKTRLFILIAMVVLVMAACGPSAPSAVAPVAGTEPAAVAQVIHTAMNAQNLEAAMALIADDAVFKNTPPSGATLTGKDAIRVWVQRQVDTKTIGEISDLKVTGDRVTFNAKATRGGAPLAGGPAAIIIKNGKITLWDFNASP